MYCKIQDFIDDFREESEKTLSIFSALTDRALKTKVYPEGRDIETICRHIIFSLEDMLNSLGIEFEPQERTKKFENVHEINALYQKFVGQILAKVPITITDNDLEKDVAIYGEKWKIKQVLYGFLKHEIHHRAQITVLMRQSGLRVPGVYGPSKEEWKNYGIQPEE